MTLIIHNCVKKVVGINISGEISEFIGLYYINIVIKCEIYKKVLKTTLEIS